MLETIQNEPHPIFKAIALGNFDDFKKIIDEDHRVLTGQDSQNRTPIFYAIRCGKLKIVEEIISQAQSVLEEKDSMGDTPISYAIKCERSEIAKAILNNINEDSSVLEQKDSDGNTPIFYANKEIAEAIIEKYPSVLEQKNSYGNTPIFYAIFKKNKEIAEVIIEKYPSALEQKNSNGNTPIVYAALMSVMSSGHDNEDKASEVLQIILDYQFQRHIDKASQEDFKESLLKEMLLKGIYSGEEVFSNLKCLEKAFDKITPESTFKKIYKDLFENVDKNQPITSIKKEKMFVFQSKLNRHLSFFIFHVNKANELTSIGYCDGNKIDQGRRIEGSTTHINGVTTFKLNTPIEYDNDFAKDFINENTKDKSLGVFYDKFRKKEIIVQGKRIEFSEITYSIPTKIQKRNNCGIKSLLLVGREILLQKNPKTMPYSFNPKTKMPYGSGHAEYKKFKIKLAGNALDFLIKIKREISSKSDPFSEYLKKEIEDITKIAGVYNKRKLILIPESKKRRKVTMGHEAIRSALSKESPNESLSPRTNETSPLSTNMTDRSHK